MHIYVFKIWYRRVKFNKHAIFRYWHINAVPKNLGFLAEPPCSKLIFDFFFGNDFPRMIFPIIWVLTPILSGLAAVVRSANM